MVRALSANIHELTTRLCEETTREELVEHFDERVAAIVCELSDDKSLDKVARKRAQIDKAAHKSAEAQTVALADKIHNCLSVSQIEKWPVWRIQGYCTWAKKVVDQVSVFCRLCALSLTQNTTISTLPTKLY